jgi:monoamine oxidase
VPLSVAERLKKAGGNIYCGAKLLGFQQDADGIVLHFEKGSPAYAKALILAMPRRALELITPQRPLLQDQEVIQLIQSVTPRPLFKLFTTYQYPWWLSAGVEKGRTTTDLPIRQTYYWPNDDGAPARKGRPMLMAGYDDGLNIGCWGGFRPKRGRGWREGSEKFPLPKLFKGTMDENADAYKEWFQYQVPEDMLEEVQRQLAVIHGLQFTPRAVDASFKDCEDDPFGGGWNSWNIGFQSWEVKGQILNPVKGVPVYICGEAYSDAQGWVEGALQTADMLLRNYFGVPPLAVSAESMRRSATKA